MWMTALSYIFCSIFSMGIGFLLGIVFMLDDKN